MSFITGDNSIIYTENGKVLAQIDFPSAGKNIVNICHTQVNKAAQGKGLAGELVKLAAEEVRRTGRKAELSCSYAIKWFREHPGYEDILI